MAKFDAHNVAKASRFDKFDVAGAVMFDKSDMSTNGPFDFFDSGNQANFDKSDTLNRRFDIFDSAKVIHIPAPAGFDKSDVLGGFDKSDAEKGVFLTNLTGVDAALFDKFASRTGTENFHYAYPQAGRSIPREAGIFLPRAREANLSKSAAGRFSGSTAR